MSKQKTVTLEQKITNIELLKRAIQCVKPGAVIDTTSKINKNQWHEVPTELNVGADHLVTDATGKPLPLSRNEGAYGDVGFGLVNGVLTAQVCSAEDSHYIDNAIRRKAERAGVKVNQPDGKFAADMQKFVEEIGNAYGALELSEKIKKKAPSIRITSPAAKSVPGRKSAWVAQGTISESDLNKLVASGGARVIGLGY